MSTNLGQKLDSAVRSETPTDAAFPETPTDAAFPETEAEVPAADSKYDHLMLDIETLSTDTSEALVLSIGFVSFNLRPSGPTFGEKTLLILPIAEQIAMGRRIDAGTLEFWQRQSKEAKAHWADPAYVQQGVRIYRRLVQDILDRNALNAYLPDDLTDDFKVWANGIVFDIGNIENLFRLRDNNGKASPWRYNATRDMRTIIRCNPEQRELFGFDSDAPTNAHDPIADCIYQISKLYLHVDQSELTTHTFR